MEHYRSQIEKIARDCCHDIENRSDDCDMVMHAKVMKALAQARAPLIAALKLAAMRMAEIISKGELGPQYWGYVEDIRRVALTGTEISRVKEGETTTTQKRR